MLLARMALKPSPAPGTGESKCRFHEGIMVSFSLFSSEQTEAWRDY